MQIKFQAAIGVLSTVLSNPAPGMVTWHNMKTRLSIIDSTKVLEES